MPSIFFRVLGWIHSDGFRLEKAEACPPATLVKSRVFCEEVIENMYPAFVAGVDSALRTWARFCREAESSTVNYGFERFY
jgi:hypothetical protein